MAEASTKCTSCQARKVLQAHSQCVTHALCINGSKYNPGECDFCNKAILEATVLGNEAMATKLLEWLNELKNKNIEGTDTNLLNNLELKAKEVITRDLPRNSSGSSY